MRMCQWRRKIVFSSFLLDSFPPSCVGLSWFNCSMEFARSSYYRLAIHVHLSPAPVHNRCGTNRVISWSFVRNWQILDTLHSLRCQQFRTLFSVRKFWGERSKSRKFYTFNAHVQRYFPYADEGVHVSKTSVLSRAVADWADRLFLDLMLLRVKNVFSRSIKNKIIWSRMSGW